MKKLFFFSFFFLSVSAFAQKQAKVDSVYYLLDTAKIPLNENMWNIEIERPYKNFMIKCACLQYNTSPTLFRRVTDKGKLLSASEMKLYKLEKLPELIVKAKKFVENNFRGYMFFLIEPQGDQYILHRVGIVPPSKPEIIN